MEPDSQRIRSLVAIKTLHTLIWAVLAGCILAIPVAGAQGRFLLASVLTGIVLAECLILAMNRGRCPLTDLAARHTEERTANFDIYLPRWLARHNKAVFGTVFCVGELFLLWRWWIALK